MRRPGLIAAACWLLAAAGGGAERPGPNEVAELRESGGQASEAAPAAPSSSGANGARPPEVRTDRLHLSAQGDLVRGARDGGGGGVTWQRSRGRRTTVAGLHHFRLGDAEWTYGRAGLAAPAGRWMLSGELDLGRGSDGRDEGFSYLSLRAGAMTALIERRLYLELEERFLHIHDERGHVVRGGLHAYPEPATGVSIAYVHGLGGTLAARFVTLRVDRNIGPRLRLFAGAAVGRQGDALPQDRQQAFAGAAIDLGHSSLVFGWASYAGDGTSHQQIITNWTLPL